MNENILKNYINSHVRSMGTINKLLYDLKYFGSWNIPEETSYNLIRGIIQEKFLYQLLSQI
jgi:hypothetical protein